MLAVSATRVVVNAANTSGTKRMQAKKKVGGKVRDSSRRRAIRACRLVSSMMVGVAYPSERRVVPRSIVSSIDLDRVER